MRLAGNPGQQTIRRLKGVIDIYLDGRGGWVARGWPKKRKRKAKPDEFENQELFKRVIANYSSRLAGMLVDLIDQTRGRRIAPRDMYVRLTYNGRSLWQRSRPWDITSINPIVTPLVYVGTQARPIGFLDVLWVQAVPGVQLVATRVADPVRYTWGAKTTRTRICGLLTRITTSDEHDGNVNITSPARPGQVGILLEGTSSPGTHHLVYIIWAYDKAGPRFRWPHRSISPTLLYTSSK